MTVVPSESATRVDREASGYFVSRWKGEAPLWKAFWIDYFLGQAIAGTCCFGLIFLTAHFSSLQFWPIPKVLSYYLAISSFYLVFLFVVSVFVWRCAPNTGRLLWGYLARTIVSIEFIWFLWKYLRLAYVLSSIVGR
jgi:hypothetical protein